MEYTELISEHYGLSKFPEKVSEAMAYVPFQEENSPIYSAVQGFSVGTMYPSLNKPFYGNKCGGKNE